MSDAMELPKASVLRRFGLTNMNCVFCGEEVHLSQINWDMLEKFKELVHLGSCTIARSAFHAKSRGC